MSQHNVDVETLYAEARPQWDRVSAVMGELMEAINDISSPVVRQLAMQAVCASPHGAKFTPEETEHLFRYGPALDALQAYVQYISWRWEISNGMGAASVFTDVADNSLRESLVAYAQFAGRGGRPMPLSDEERAAMPADPDEEIAQQAQTEPRYGRLSDAERQMFEAWVRKTQAEDPNLNETLVEAIRNGVGLIMIDDRGVIGVVFTDDDLQQLAEQANPGAYGSNAFGGE